MSKDSETKKPNKISIHLPNEETLKALQVILTYESEIRGRTLGQTCYEMVADAVDLSSYPEELQTYLEEVQEAERRHAISQSISYLNAL